MAHLPTTTDVSRAARRAALWTCACASLTVARADVLLTTDGRVVQDRPLERTDTHVVVRFEHGEVRVPNEQVQELFLDQEAENLPASRKIWLKKKLQEKADTVAEALRHAEWRDAYEESSKYFDWKYTIARPIGKGMQMRFDKYYEYFKKRWKLKPSAEGKLLVNFYRNSQQYQRTAGAPPGALAYFKFVPPYDLNACFDRQDPVVTEMVLYHELSHYVQKLIAEDFKMPHWPGEGLSEYYGGAVWNDEKSDFEWGLIQEGRLTEIQRDLSLDKYLTIREIVVEPAYTDYTWGWALVHFLMSDAKRASAFEKYVLGLARDKGIRRVDFGVGLNTVEGEESLRYFMECLKLKDEKALTALQDEYYAYLREMKATSASGIEKAAIAAQNTGKSLRAKRLFEEADQAGGLSAQGCHHYASLVRGSDKKLARDLYRRATELDPLSGYYWYRLGKLMLAEEGEKQEGERLIALAKELDPEVDSSDIELTFGSEGEDDGE